MTETEQQAMDLIMQACKLMGWQLAFEAEDDDTEVEGFVIGTNEFVVKHFSEEV